MLSEIVDTMAPVLPPGFPHSVVPASPVPLDGPTTLQLAIVGLVTLGAYALLRRPQRTLSAIKAQRTATTDEKTSAKPSVRTREAA